MGFALAASSLIAAVALWMTLGMAPQPLHYATGPGEQRIVVLADGSRITLNTRTRLDVTIQNGRRDVVLEGGEAFRYRPRRHATLSCPDFGRSGASRRHAL